MQLFHLEIMYIFGMRRIAQLDNPSSKQASIQASIQASNSLFYELMHALMHT